MRSLFADFKHLIHRYRENPQNSFYSFRGTPQRSPFPSGEGYSILPLVLQIHKYTAKRCARSHGAGEGAVLGLFLPKDIGIYGVTDTSDCFYHVKIKKLFKFLSYIPYIYVGYIGVIAIVLPNGFENLFS